MEVVRGCLRDGADPNFALYWAAGKRLGGRRHSVRLGPIRLMIAEVGIPTPLKSAAFFGHTAAVEWLLGHGADWRVIDDWGKTALDWARQNGHAEAVAALNIFANY